MKAAWVVIGVALVLASGCAQQDWIDRTLVTVDVTGTWSGLVEGTGAGMASDFRLELSQEGPAVKGTVQARATGVGDLSGPLQGTVGGDMFRFTAVNSCGPRLASRSQRACYLPSLKVSGALRYALTFSRTPEAWREVRQHIPWLLAEQSRIRKAGWFN